MFITEDWTYPSALAGSAPHNIKPVGVLMDDQGMRSDALRELLAGWDEAARGCRRSVFMRDSVPLKSMLIPMQAPRYVHGPSWAKPYGRSEFSWLALHGKHT